MKTITTTIKTILFASLIVAMILPLSGMDSQVFGEKSELSKKDLQDIFGDDSDLATQYHEKDQKVKEHEKKKNPTESEKDAKYEAKIQRALDLGKLNAKGYMTKSQLDNTLESGIPI